MVKKKPNRSRHDRTNCFRSELYRQTTGSGDCSADVLTALESETDQKLKIWTTSKLQLRVAIKVYFQRTIKQTLSKSIIFDDFVRNSSCDRDSNEKSVQDLRVSKNGIFFSKLFLLTLTFKSRRRKILYDKVCRTGKRLTGKRIGRGNILRGIGDGKMSYGEMADGEASQDPFFQCLHGRQVKHVRLIFVRHIGGRTL